MSLITDKAASWRLPLSREGLPAPLPRHVVPLMETGTRGAEARHDGVTGFESRRREVGCSYIYVCVCVHIYIYIYILRRGGRRRLLFSRLIEDEGTQSPPSPAAQAPPLVVCPRRSPGTAAQPPSARRPRVRPGRCRCRCRCPPRGVTAGQAAAAAERGCGAGAGRGDV